MRGDPLDRRGQGEHFGPHVAGGSPLAGAPVECRAERDADRLAPEGEEFVRGRREIQVVVLVLLEEVEERVPHASRMEARLRLWELTQDRAHLAEAHRLLGYARDHAPVDYRTSMIENVPLHRDIMKAWEEHGTGGD